ncbi:DUF6850 family outer membrane beta-barrel protein [Rapidithrix thailandica]|uniref:DUF6850 family outer membrane beta-barrel protein n=1 Tax=Rapidithrix thailandica TaxID=413964 RepID=A0AAW9RZX6_9BACT
MRIRILILLWFWFLAGNQVFSQTSRGLAGTNSIERNFLHTHYQQAYAEMPSMLSLWKHSSWAFIEGQYTQGKGAFRHPQKYRQTTGLTLSTESLYRLEKTQWTFYGKFDYGNKKADSVMHNLSYTLPDNGSPYYFLIKKAGSWNIQKYHFKVSASNQLPGRKLSLGFKLRYNSDLSYRKVDTRNAQTALTMSAVLSATYLIKPEQMFSIGFKIFRKKTEPSLHNKYQHSTQDLTYNIYINTGMGSYLKNINSGITIRETQPGISVQWVKDTERKYWSLHYQLDFGRESWENRNINAVEVENTISRYHYTRHALSLASIRYFPKAYLSSHLKLERLQGNGETWNENIQTFLENYLTRLNKARLSSELYFPEAWITKVGLHLAYDATRNTDKNYGYKLQFSTLTMETDIAFVQPVQDHKLSATFKGGYRKNLHLMHNPYSAHENLYTEWIAYPVMSYLTADGPDASICLGFETPVQQKNILQWEIQSIYRQATRINSQHLASIRKGDDFLQWYTRLRIYF